MSKFKVGDVLICIDHKIRITAVGEKNYLYMYVPSVDKIEWSSSQAHIDNRSKLAPKIIQGWVNIWKNSSGDIRFGCIHSSEENAEEARKDASDLTSLKIIKITYEEE